MDRPFRASTWCSRTMCASVLKRKCGSICAWSACSRASVCWLSALMRCTFASRKERIRSCRWRRKKIGAAARQPKAKDSRMRAITRGCINQCARAGPIRSDGMETAEATLDSKGDGSNEDRAAEQRGAQAGESPGPGKPLGQVDDRDGHDHQQHGADQNSENFPWKPGGRLEEGGPERCSSPEAERVFHVPQATAQDVGHIDQEGQRVQSAQPGPSERRVVRVDRQQPPERQRRGASCPARPQAHGPAAPARVGVAGRTRARVPTLL